MRKNSLDKGRIKILLLEAIHPSAVEAFFQTSEPELARELHEAMKSTGSGFFEPAEDDS